MCAGGQDIPVTLRVAGGVEGGKWKSENDVRATPQPEEEVETTETTETTEVPEPVGPSTPLYQPVIDRINKLSEKLPDEVADETVQEMHPMMQHGWSMNNRNYMQTRQLLDRIMHNTRPRGPRPPRPGGPGKWGGGGRTGGGYPLNKNDPRRPQQTLGTQLVANQQLAGLTGLFGRPKVLKPEQTTPEPLQNPIQFPQQPTQQPMQPEVIEEQERQMEILGQPKQFAGGGIVNALMATPIGQSAIREYAKGGDITFDSYKYDYGPTGDSMEDILHGIIYGKGTDKERPARFFGSQSWLDDPSQPVVDWGRKEEDETPTLKSVRKILKPKKKEEPHQDSTMPEDPNRGFVGPGPGAAMDKATGVDTFSGMRGDPLGLSGLISGAMSQPGSTLANFVLGLVQPHLGIANTISNLLGGPTIGDLFAQKTATDKALEEVAKAEIGDQSAYDLYGGTHGALEAAEELGEIMGWDEGATASTDRGEQDIEAQVDTFSDYSDNAGSPGTGDSAAEDEAGHGIGDAGEFG